MNLIVIHKDFAERKDSLFLRLISTCNPMAKTAFKRMSQMIRLNSDEATSIVLPQSWAHDFVKVESCMRFYDEQTMQLSWENYPKPRENKWFIISNGRFISDVDQDWFEENLKALDADLVSVYVDPELNACRERVRFTSQGKIAGFRRLYSASAHLGDDPDNWPHHLFVRSNHIPHLFNTDGITLDFQKLSNRAESLKLKKRTLHVAGSLLDLTNEADVLNFFREQLQFMTEYENHDMPPQCTMDASARIFGKVQIGQNVTIEKDALIIGPTIIGNNVAIGLRSVIRSSILASHTTIKPNEKIENTIVLPSAQPDQQNVLSSRTSYLKYLSSTSMLRKDYDVNNFRMWRGFCYANHIKRLADFLSALAVLLLFAPVIPLIALVIKLTSPGPIFFGHSRQGLHGKEFKCWKFRTMLVGADDLQMALRARNEVDGPQFKIEDDPRINGVGHFLRETCLDEIPQFFNVLMGQMSLVGPRPSPEKENLLCPPWRDARLSVRPGITGLWQVCRTRQQSQDFQEWVYYDTQYVKILSWKKDLWICFATAKELATRFISQF